MTTYNIEDSEWSRLNGKTILIVGGCTGLGRAAVEIAHKSNANVALGDWNEHEGAVMSKELKDRFVFHQCDVANWGSILGLFDAAVEKFGTIHAVLSNAGISGEKFLADEIDPQTGRLAPPSLKVLDVNLDGMVYVTKAALHYFSKWPDTQCQLVLTGSAASYIDGYEIPLYTAAKMGVLGLMRGLRCMLVGKKVTINMVAPWATDTPMLRKGGIQKVWEGLPMNTPTDAARALLLPVLRPEIHGKSFWVGGGEIIEVEDKTHETQPIWMTKTMSDFVDEGQHRIVPNFEQVVLSYRRKAVG